jgi:ketosteroid isomerase-like protein
VPSDLNAEIVEKVLASFAAFNRGDFDETVAVMHPDVEYIPVGGQAPIRGVERLREWMEPSAWDRQVIEPLDITVTGRKILVHSRTSARGAGSGIEMEVEAWTVMTLDADLLVIRIETFLPHEEAKARQAAAVADPGSPG